MITREDLVSQSVMNFARTGMYARGYTPAVVEFIESFPYTREGPLTRNLIAAGFDFDDGGTQAELGSDLRIRLYTIEFFVFGLTNTYARNIANALKFTLDADDGRVPLIDIADPGLPIVDYLLVDSCSAERQVIPDPEPWQQFCFTTTLRVHDEYKASLV